MVSTKTLLKLSIALTLLLAVPVAAASSNMPSPLGKRVHIPFLEIHTALGTGSQTCGMLSGDIATIINQEAPWYCPINQEVYAQWANDIPLVAIAVLLSFMVAALLIMAGIAIKNERLRSFGIAEIYEAIATAIVVGFFLYINAVMFGVLPALTVGEINPFATAFNLITQTISSAESIYSSIFSLYVFTKMVTSLMSVNRYIPTIMAIVTVPVTAYLIDPSIAIAGFLSSGIEVLYAQYYVLVFFASSAIPAFLVPGIVLRSILPTRALGAMLIALAIGFYIIAPSLFALAYYFTSAQLRYTMTASASQLSRFAQNPSQINPSGFSSSSPIATQLKQTQYAMSTFWLLMLFYPMIITGMTYAFVVQISEFLGSMTHQVGRVRSFI